MKSLLRKVTPAVLAATVALLLALAVAPGHRATAADAYLLALGAIALAALVTSTRELAPSPDDEDSPLDRPPAALDMEGAPIAELERIDRVLVLAGASEFDVHYRLRPLFREIALERLATRRGIELDQEPERAREALGAELWELVRPGRELGRRAGPGVKLPEAARLVDALERV